MSSFGQSLVCKNLTCTTINGNAPSGGSTKWTDIGNDNIERTNGNVIVKNELIAETVTINDKLVVENAIEMFSGGIQAAAGDFTGCECINLEVDNVKGKSGTVITVNNDTTINGGIINFAQIGSKTNLELQGSKSANSAFISLNTGGVDEANASTIYFINFEKKPDNGTFFRINMSGDIIGARNVALERLTLPTQLSYKGCEVITALTSGDPGTRTVIIPAGSYICFFDLTLTTADVGGTDTTIELTFDTTALPITANQINNRNFTYDLSGLVVQDANDPDDALFVYNFVKGGQFVTKLSSSRVLLGQRINFTIKFIEIEN